jgi:glucose/arabinose dehydrogenase
MPPRPSGALALVVAFGLAASPTSRAQQAAQTPPPRVIPVEVQKSARHDFRIVTVADGLDHPWCLAWLPTGEMLITERPGRLRVVRGGTLDPNPVAGLPRVYRQRGQGGLMDVLPHPEFAANRLIYLSYAKPLGDGSQGATTVARARFDGRGLVNVQEIFESKAAGPNNNHFAGRMAFDKAGFLYVAVGDRMVTPDLMAAHPAQDLATHMGKLVRLHDDGRVPADNPFVGRPDALPEIWSYGHRNPQGLSVDPASGRIWLTEHGPRGGDELNLVARGANYGWPVVSYGVHYDGKVFTTETSRVGLASPVLAWVPSIGVSGLMVYAGDKFPWWTGSLFAGGLVGERLDRITLDGDRAVSQEVLLASRIGRIRDVRQGPDGFIYLALEEMSQPSAVVRLEPVPNDIAGPRIR